LDNSNRIISPIRVSTPPPLKYNSLIQAWSVDKLRTTFGNFRKVHTDPVKQLGADEYILLPDRLITPVRILNFTSQSTPRPQIPVQHPPATGSADRSQFHNTLPFHSEETIPQDISVDIPVQIPSKRPDSLELSDISEIKSD
jgi:hypothetical protein